MAKVREDFVTNSSSSSFVVAKNDKCTVEEIKEKLSLLRKEIKETIRCYSYDYDKEITDKKVDIFIVKMSQILFDTPRSLILGDWIVSAEEYSNENDEYDGFIYEYGHKLNTDNFKIESSW